MDNVDLENKTGRQQTAQAAWPEPGVLNDVQAVWQELRVLVHDHFKIATLEAQQAAKSLVVMIIAGLMVAIILIGAWLGLAAAGVLWLTEQGIAQSTAILIAVGASLLLALVLCAVIRHYSHYLKFTALLRSLQSISPQWERNIP
jgi:hypothetical protein